MSPQNIIIFTDLDACLLDHNNYSYTAAKPLLHQLKKHKIPLIINSSKTKLEIEQLQQELDFKTPYIIENGAAIIVHPEERRMDCNVSKHFSMPRTELLSIANSLRNQYGFKYTGFNDMTTEQLSTLTKLSLEEANAAKQREFSEPILWQDNQAQLKTFSALLLKQNIRVQKGGRFFHLGGQCNKGEAMQWLLKHWTNTCDKRQVIAIGDSKNDESMLNMSDYAIVIKNKDSTLNVQGKKKTIFSSLPGTAGWVETLTPLIKQLS